MNKPEQGWSIINVIIAMGVFVLIFIGLYLTTVVK